jgi:voltage-gated potassium channel Kch
MQEQLDKRIFQILVTFTLIVLGGGMIFYHIVEKLSWVNAYYFCVVSLTTVGYGDITPHTTAGKIFTTFYLMIGVVILGAFLNAIMKRRSQKMAVKQAEVIKAKDKAKS